MITQTTQRASFSFFSVAALMAAVFSFATGAIWGLVLAVIAIASGLIGILLALLPGTRGGFISAFAVLAGFAGVGAAVIKLLGAIAT